MVRPDLRGARVALFGPFASRDVDDLAASLRASGAEICPLGAPGVTHVVHGRCALEVARALGSPRMFDPAVHWIAEDALVEAVERKDGGSGVESTRLHACAERIASGLATAEDIARFAAAVLRGARRWDVSSPIAVEIACRNESEVRELGALARRAGEWDVLEDERGRSIVRVEVARVPIEIRAPRTPAFHQFVARAERRKDAGLWIAGWLFRAPASRNAWRPLLDAFASG